jgi:hypothetical protein
LLNDAERVAQSAGWGAKDKIKYFSDRLRGDAADWHSDYIDHAADKEDYDAWEKPLISRFLTETEIENPKKQLNELKQTRVIPWQVEFFRRKKIDLHHFFTVGSYVY